MMIATASARPYATAAFEYALEKNALASWENMLEIAAHIAEQQELQALLSNPDIAADKILELFFSILEPVLDEKKKNFLKLLAEYKRLAILPAVYAFFVRCREEHEKTIAVELISATPVTKEYQQLLEKKLAKKLQRTISLSTSVDPNLMGGALVRAGDLVFDGSVRGKLNRLLESF